MWRCLFLAGSGVAMRDGNMASTKRKERERVSKRKLVGKVNIYRVREREGERERERE